MTEETLELRERLQRAMSSSEMSLNAIAGEIGISGAALSQYANGKYKAANPSGVEAKISAWLDKRETRSTAHSLIFPLVETVAYKHITELANNCRLGKEIGVCVGPAGIGKTTSVTAFAKNNPDVILVYCFHRMNMKSLLQRICKGLKLDTRGSAATLFDNVATKLHEGDYTIILDEAEHLTVDMLDDMRRLADPEVGGCGLLFIGLERFLESVKTQRNDYAYLFSRIRHTYKGHELSNRGVEQLVLSILPESGDLWRMLAKYTHTPREIVNMIKAIDQAAWLNNIPLNNVDATLVEQAVKYTRF